MNPYMEFAHKTDLAYSALCHSLCRELNLPQTAFDILLFLANNPECDTASDIVELRKIKGESCVGQRQPTGRGRLSVP